MQPYFTKLGVDPEIRDFFKGCYQADQTGQIFFPYGDATEYYSPAYHKAAVSENLLIAGNTNYHMVRQVILCFSCMDAIAFLSLNRHKVPHLKKLLVLSTGLRPVPEHARWIRAKLPRKSFVSIFGNDVLSKVAEVKLLAGIRRIPVVFSLSGETLTVKFRMRNFDFGVEDFSVNALERLAGYRFGIASLKPKDAETWIQQLQYQNSNLK